jgi:hypothetical protein
MADSAPVIKSKMTSGIRISIALFVAISLAIFIYVWDSKIIYGFNFPEWLGPYILFPFISIVLGYGSNCLIQFLSCNKVEAIKQLQLVSIGVIPQLFIWGLLNFFTSLRWPIEGLVQEWTPEQRKGVSSGFYGFWIALYTQSIMNGFAQTCPS